MEPLTPYWVHDQARKRSLPLLAAPPKQINRIILCCITSICTVILCKTGTFWNIIIANTTEQCSITHNRVYLARFTLLHQKPISEHSNANLYFSSPQPGCTKRSHIQFINYQPTLCEYHKQTVKFLATAIHQATTYCNRSKHILQQQHLTAAIEYHINKK